MPDNHDDSKDPMYLILKYLDECFTRCSEEAMRENMETMDVRKETGLLVKRRRDGEGG